MGDLVINAFKVAAAGATYAFQGVPDAVGALAVGAANAVIDALNWMIEKALAGINALAEAANAALEAGGLDPALSTLDPATFRIDSVANPYAARDAERRAALAAQIRGIVSGSPLSEYFDDVRDRALQISITPDDPAEGGAGGGGGPLQTAEEVAAAADIAATGWAAVSEALSTYASEAANWGGSVGEPVAPPPYTRDWGESRGREVMWEAARAFLIEIPLSAAEPGALILFRMVATSPAKHCGRHLQAPRRFRMRR